MWWNVLNRLTRPQRLAIAILLITSGGYLGVQGWGWYHLDRAAASLHQFDLEAARQHVQKCLTLWPRSPQVHLLASRAARRANDFALAEEHLDQCRQYAPPGMADDIAFEWSLQRAAMGDLSTVEGSLQARLLKRPTDAPLIWEALAEGYRRHFRMPEALRTLDTWLHFEPQNAHAYFLRGEVHRQVGALNRARAEYEHVIELQPDHREARRHLARCLVQVGRYQEAAQHLDALLRESPDDADLLTLKARSLYDLGQRQEGIALLEKALRLHPDDGPALRERARAAFAAEQFPEAEQWYRQAVAVLPDNYEVQWGLYQTLQAQHKTAEADEQLAKAQQLKNAFERIHEIQTHEMTQRPDDPNLHAELGEMLLQVGQEAAGEAQLLIALQLDPNLLAAHEALARWYDQHGQPDLAQQYRLAAQRLAASDKTEDK